jgi:hypothetical protein
MTDCLAAFDWSAFWYGFAALFAVQLAASALVWTVWR